MKLIYAAFVTATIIGAFAVRCRVILSSSASGVSPPLVMR
jgi:hypothetical protein